ncbi:MAG: hypothetical protein J07HQW1_01960 [Haloquadratum walsbyi J07HQW1]|uniref:Uncharacterized protein n=1 Tax=Haloquadratum walsbyi J07HQW1 TaxID=1238424 RepID=U1PIE1_9EURY|nr:MAG: hypothetical protein J07HQW1_01960 [Haloquadratum walsbyi J07HQW1]
MTEVESETRTAHSHLVGSEVRYIELQLCLLTVIPVLLSLLVVCISTDIWDGNGTLHIDQKLDSTSTSGSEISNGSQST